MKDEYEKDKNNWLPRTDNPINEAFDKRTPGLFKIEKADLGIIALTCKSYNMKTTETVKSKGGQKDRNILNLTWDKYYHCLKDEIQISGGNMGFRRDKNCPMKTYINPKILLTPIYTKRVIMDDGIHTRPLTKYDWNIVPLEISDSEETSDVI